MAGGPAEPEQIVQRQVFIRGANRPFGEFTLDDARERADELRAATGWGPTARVASVALAWRELAIGDGARRRRRPSPSSTRRSWSSWRRSYGWS